MISRTPLPPPPPPEESRSWPDDAARLADRAAALAELSRRGLGIVRLALLWLLGAVAALGWAATGLAIQSFEAGGLGFLTAVVALILAGVLLIPAAVALGFWLNRGHAVRQRLEEWAALDPAPVPEAQELSQRRSVLWLLPSVVLSLAGSALVSRSLTGAVEESTTLGETAYLTGLGGTLVLIGFLGLVQSVGHQRWSARLRHPIPVRRGGGSHR